MTINSNLSAARACFGIPCAALALACSLLPLTLQAQAPLPVYTDELVNGFQDWGWATHDYANLAPVHSGSRSIAVTIDSPWVGLQIYHPDLAPAPYRALHFWANGGATGGQKVQLYALIHAGSTNNFALKPISLTPLAKNEWQEFSILLASLGVTDQMAFTGFVIQDVLGRAQPTFYLDDVELTPSQPPAVVHLSVRADQTVRGVDPRWFGVNTAIWDSHFDTPTTVELLQEMGTRLLRAPGGSLSDEYHWSTGQSLNNTWRWVTTFGDFVQVATQIGAQAFITVNYGTGSPNEAAAWVAYANGAVTNSQPLGTDASGTDWKTVRDWASLRAAMPLPRDDGRNFLRLGRAEPLGFRYWEIGNECYGPWETDQTASPHDAYFYALRARDFLIQMKSVDPSIAVGVVAVPGEEAFSNGHTAHPARNARTGQSHSGWTPVTLSTLKDLGVTPDFLVHHRYPEYTDKNNPAASNDNDATLLQDSTQWKQDAADLRQHILDYFGPDGANIELVCTENNSDAGAQGRQSTSLVNGLYYADSLGQLMQTEFNAFVWWDLRNGTDTAGWFDPALYGWRTYGDLGMVNGLDTRHPTFYAAKLMQRLAQSGGHIVPSSSDYQLVSIYAARLPDGELNLLVLNKDPRSAFNARIELTGFVPAPRSALQTYGIPQDEAARTNGPAWMQDLATNRLDGVSTNFTQTFPPLSLTLITLTPSGPQLSILRLNASENDLELELRPPAAGRSLLQNSPDLETWSTVSTNAVSSGAVQFHIPMIPGAKESFWRAVWEPWPD